MLTRQLSHGMSYDMKSVTTLELRQSLSKVANLLEQDGEPLLLKRGKRPIAVIISLRDYEERFVEKAACDARRSLLADIDALARSSEDPTPAADLLHETRYA